MSKSKITKCQRKNHAKNEQSWFERCAEDLQRKYSVSVINVRNCFADCADNNVFAERFAVNGSTSTPQSERESIVTGKRKIA